MSTFRSLIIVSAAVFTWVVSTVAVAQSNQPIPVVATFSILGDMVKRIGNEHVSVTTLVGPDGDVHVYQPTPANARAVSEAEVLFVNGLEFEGWLDRLVDASEFKGLRIVSTTGIDLIKLEEEEHHEDDAHSEDEKHEEEEHEDDEHHHGEFDPHGWQSLTNAIVYVNNVTAALAQYDPENATYYYQNRAKYVAEIEALDASTRKIVADLPASQRTIVTSHDAFQYFGREYGLTFLAPQGLSTDSEASAQDVADLITQMRTQGVAAVFIENITDPRLLEQIANESGATIGGTLYPGALSSSDGPASTYLEMMNHNVTTLKKALSP